MAAHSRLLFDALATVFTALGLDALEDAVFRDLVIARLVEPTSLLDAGRVLRDLRANTKGFEWTPLKSRFRHLGIDLTSLSEYSTVDECRILNNKIKHLGVVDPTLGNLPGFRGALGQPITELKLPLQRYSDDVFNYVGRILQVTNALLSDET